MRDYYKYRNRRMYGQKEGNHKNYVTFDEIVKVIRNGEEVRILDRRHSSKNITRETLLRIWYQLELKRSRLTCEQLMELIRS